MDFRRFRFVSNNLSKKSIHRRALNLCGCIACTKKNAFFFGVKCFGKCHPLHQNEKYRATGLLIEVNGDDDEVLEESNKIK